MSDRLVALYYQDPRTRQAVENALPKDNYRLLVRDVSEDAMLRKVEQRADVVLAEFDNVAESEVRIAWLRGVEAYAHAPLVALARTSSVEGERLALASGADVFIALTVDAALLRARIEASLRFVSRAHESARRCREISGSLKEVEPLRLLKFCEDRRLSGRLTVNTPAGRSWLDFLGGELVHSGSDIDEERDALDAFLAARDGTFLVEQTPLETGSLAPLPTPATTDKEPAAQNDAPPSAPLMPNGRLSIVREAPHLSPYHVQTESENRPNFTMTTLVTRDGRVIRKTRTTWQHPLASPEDRPLAQTQLDRQHERIVAKIRELAEAANAPPEPARPTGVNGILLGWAMHFIVEQVWTHLGTAVSTNLLRRTHASLIPRFPVLKLFRVWVEGRVDFDISQGPTLPLDAVEAVARWCATFLATARKLVPEISRIQVRQTTVLMEHALDQVGFYKAFENARAEIA
jgi:hypothetical protein